jgi:hypothetical protein
VFDEAVFPFQSLHANAGALLRLEILLLPPNLLNPEHGDEFVDDTNMANVPIDSSYSPLYVVPHDSARRMVQSGANSGQNYSHNSENSVAENDSSTEHGGDSLQTFSSGSSERSALDRTRQASADGPDVRSARARSPRQARTDAPS